jgi:hypothetical protein
MADVSVIVSRGIEIVWYAPCPKSGSHRGILFFREITSQRNQNIEEVLQSLDVWGVDPNSSSGLIVVRFPDVKPLDLEGALTLDDPIQDERHNPGIDQVSPGFYRLLECSHASSPCVIWEFLLNLDA